MEKKKFFGCNKVKLRGKEWNACIYLLFKCTSDEVVLFRDKSDRTHDNIQRKTSKISNEVKEEIKELFQLKLKPKAIIEIELFSIFEKMYMLTCCRYGNQIKLLLI